MVQSQTPRWDPDAGQGEGLAVPVARGCVEHEAVPAQGHGASSGVPQARDRTCSLAHDKAISALIPGPRSSFRLLIPLGQSLACNEASHARWDDGCVSAPRQHEISVPPLDVLRSTAHLSRRLALCAPPH